MSKDVEVRLREVLASDDVESLMDLGCELADQRRLSDAERCFRRAADLGWADGAFNLGNALAEQERWLEAVGAYELAIAGGDTEACVNLGWVLHELGDLSGEMRAYQAAEEAGVSEGALCLGFALREQGDRTGAMQAAQRSAAAGNEQAAAVVACWQWDLTRDPALEDALQAGAGHYPSARADLGHLLLSTGRVEEARQVWKRGMDLGEVESMLPLGNLYADVLDDDVAAEAAYLAAIELGDAHSHNNLGILLEGRGDIEGAAMHYRLAIAGGSALAVRHLQDLED